MLNFEIYSGRKLLGTVKAANALEALTRAIELWVESNLRAELAW